MAVDNDARMKLIEEHVQAEIDMDMDRIMATWGKNPSFDDVRSDLRFKALVARLKLPN